MYLLGRAGDGRALVLGGLPLAHSKEGAGQDGAEVAEGAPARSVPVVGRCQQGGDGPWEQLGQQGLLRVAVATEGARHPQQARHRVPAQVLWGGRKVCVWGGGCWEG